MLDINYLRKNPEEIKTKSADKGIDVDTDKIIELDKRHRELQQGIQSLRAERNKAAKEKDIEKGKEVKEKLASLENEFTSVDNELNTLLLQIPNIAKDDVKAGKDESENEVIKTVGEKPEFSFKPLDHVELGEKLDIIDIERAAKVSGTRFAYLKNEAVLIEFALIQFAFETVIKEGFIPVIPPEIINSDIMRSLGYMENGGDDDMFHLKDDDKVLVGTAEHSIVPMHKDEVLEGKKLPLRYVGFSSAFRREAGSYGRDTRGILRVHQFNKVEMVSFVSEERDDEEHEYLLSLEEKFFKELGIPYQVVKMCTGDLGFPAARKYDIEAWIPSQGKYREVTSVSTVTDFQSRRLNIKYQEGGSKEFAYVLNGTAFAIGRTLIAILENYQQKDGSIIVPEVLRKYINIDKITAKSS